MSSGLPSPLLSPAAATTSVDGDAPLAEGWVYKRSHLLRVWRRRKAVLYPGQVCLYQSHKGSALVLRATFPLSEECRVERAPEVHRQLHAFLLVGPRLRVYLASESVQESERWVLLLGACCRREMAELPPPTLAPSHPAGERPASPAMLALWPRSSAPDAATSAPPRAEDALLGEGCLGEAGVDDELLHAALDEDDLSRLLSPSQFAELSRWPQLQAAVQRAVCESAAYADGRASVLGWHKLHAPSLDGEVGGLIRRLEASAPAGDAAGRGGDSGSGARDAMAPSTMAPCDGWDGGSAPQHVCSGGHGSRRGSSSDGRERERGAGGGSSSLDGPVLWCKLEGGRPVGSWGPIPWVLAALAIATLAVVAERALGDGANLPEAAAAAAASAAASAPSAASAASATSTSTCPPPLAPAASAAPAQAAESNPKPDPKPDSSSAPAQAAALTSATAEPPWSCGEPASGAT